MAKQKVIIGVILSAGKGSRFGSKGVNKTASLFQDKPLLQFGIDLYKSTCSSIVVVVGAFAESVIQAISHNDSIIFAYQRKRLGTAHALQVALKEIEKRGNIPELVLLGYGDHMMHYSSKDVAKLVKAHDDSETAISMIATEHMDPSSLAWSRIIRNKEGNVLRIVEEKDATPIEKKITDLNAGFYCFKYDFLKKNYKKIKKSPVTGEYYLTTYIELAVEQGKSVKAIKVPFENVGLGINTRADLEISNEIYA